MGWDERFYSVLLERAASKVAKPVTFRNLEFLESFPEKELLRKQRNACKRKDLIKEAKNRYMREYRARKKKEKEQKC